jgi:hypothetical protein
VGQSELALQTRPEHPSPLFLPWLLLRLLLWLLLLLLLLLLLS